ncbi:hypothetical protein HDU77_000360, partial [Chytriomyces hyalinus]
MNNNNPNTPPDEIANTTKQPAVHPPIGTSLTTLQQHRFNSQPQHTVADWPHHHHHHQQTAFMNSIATPPTASPLELPSSATTTRLRMGSSLSANPANNNNNNFISPSFAGGGGGGGGRSHSLDHGATTTGLLNLQPLNYTVAGVGVGVGVGVGAVHSWVTPTTGLLQNFQNPNNVFNNLSAGNGNGASLRDVDSMNMSETVYTAFNAPTAQSMHWNSMSELSPTTWNPINTFPTFNSPHLTHSSLLSPYSFQDHRQQQQQQPPQQPQQQQHLQLQQLQQEQQLQQQQQQSQQSYQFSNVHRNSISTPWGSDPLSILTHQNQTHDPIHNNLLSSEPQPIITTCSPLQFSSIVSGGSPHQYSSSTSLTTASPHSLHQQQPLSAIETVYNTQPVQGGEPTLVHSIPLQPSPSITDKLSPKSVPAGRETLGRRTTRRQTLSKRDVDKDLEDRGEKVDDASHEDSEDEDEEEDDSSDTASDGGGATFAKKRGSGSVVKRAARNKKAASSSSLGSSYKNNKRFRIPRDQMVWLKKVFSETPLPSIERMAEIANEVGVDVHKIKI